MFNPNNVAEAPRFVRFEVTFVDGVVKQVWAGSHKHAVALAKLLRQSLEPGSYYVQAVNRVWRKPKC